jgi:hypothetical protein
MVNNDVLLELLKNQTVTPEDVLKVLQHLDQLDAELAQAIASVVSLLYLDSALSYVALALILVLLLAVSVPKEVRMRALDRIKLGPFNGR